MRELDKKLIKATGKEDLELAKSLISQGADVNALDDWRNSTLSNAIWDERTQVMDFLFKHGARIHINGGHNLIMHACFNGKYKSVLWLLDKGVNPNFLLESTGETPLHYTIVKQDDSVRTEIVKALIDAGADVNKKTIPKTETACFMRDAYLKGETPLHRAAAYGDEEMIKALKDAGADLTIKDANGDTPLSWGSWHLRPSNILGLLLYGNVPGWYGFPNPNLNGEDLK
ncbi:MAG: ankyrin repeat domain-containing protein [Saprospiraceae bacterium]